jgi:hypothetical protein
MYEWYKIVPGEIVYAVAFIKNNGGRIPFFDATGSISSAGAGKEVPLYLVLEENRPPTVIDMNPRGGVIIPDIFPDLSAVVDDPDRSEGYLDYPSSAIVRMYEKDQGAYRLLTSKPYSLPTLYEGTDPVPISFPWFPIGKWRRKARAWFDAASITGISDATALAQWDDISGARNHATQGLAASQPTYRTNRQNGLPGVEFDGTNDLMDILGLTATSMQETVLVVAKLDDLTAGAVLVGTNEWYGRSVWIWTDGFAYISIAAVGNVASSSPTSAPIGVTTLFSFTLLPTTAEISFNGATPTSVIHSMKTTAGALSRLGNNEAATTPWDGDMYEVIVLSDLTDAERQEAEGYLAWKWGLVASLPSGHPYKNVSPHTVQWSPGEPGSSGAPHTWTPADLPTGTMKAWFDATQITGVADGSPLVTWEDLSSNLVNANQGTNVNKPTYRTNRQNGLPGVEFDGVNDRMLTALTASSRDETIISAIKVDDFTGTSDILSPSASSGRDLSIVLTTGKPRISKWGITSIYENPAAITAGEATIVHSTLTPTTAVVTRNGEIITPIADSLTFTAGITSILGDNFAFDSPFDGDMYEVIVCSALSLPDRQKVEGYLAWKWGTQGTLDAAHPYKDLPPQYVPVPVSDKLVAWHSADEITGIADGAKIPQWNDQSGTGNHATQGTDGDRPTYRTNRQNGLPAVDFVSFDSLVSNVSSSSLDETIVAVIDIDTSSDTHAIINAPVEQGRLLRVEATTRLLGLWNLNPVANLAVSSVAVPVDIPTIVSSTLNPTWAKVGVNGTTTAPASHSTTLDPGLTSVIGLRSSVPHQFNGTIYELMVFQPALTDRERQRVEGYLAHKYNIAHYLPNTHPYKTRAPNAYAPEWLDAQDIPAWTKTKKIGPTIDIDVVSPSLVTSISGPGQIAINSKGVIYLADTGNNQLLVLNGDGSYNIRLTGTTGITGVAVDSSDLIYVAYGTTLRCYTPEFVQKWTVTDASTLRHVAVGASLVWVTRATTNQWVRYNATTGALISVHGGTGSTDGLFNTAWGIVFNNYDGLVYVLDRGNNRIQVFTTAGVFVRKYSIIPSGLGRGVAVDERGNILNADPGTGVIERRSPTGALLTDTYKTITESADGVAVEKNGSVWVANYLDNVVVRWQKRVPQYASTYAWMVEVADEIGGITGRGYGGRDLETEGPDGSTEFIITNTGVTT